MSDPKIPDLPDVGSTPESWMRFMETVREILQVREGRRGNALDEGVTFRDLVGFGLAERTASGRWEPGAGAVGPAGPAGPAGPPGSPYVPDYTAPPTPSGLAITTLTRGAFIEWDAPVYTQGHGNAYTKVYIAQRASLSDPLPVFGDAVYAGQSSGGSTFYVHEAATGAIVHAWIAFVSVDGIESAVPAGGANGVSVTVGKIDGATEIAAASIVNALIANLAVDDAKIASLGAAKLLAGAIAVGEDIRSTNYVAGVSGWRIEGSGAAQLPALAILGQLVAAQIDTRGLSIKDAAGNVVFKAGYQAGLPGNMIANPHGDIDTEGWPNATRLVASFFGIGDAPCLRTQYRDTPVGQKIYVRPGESYAFGFVSIPEGGAAQASGWNIKFGCFTYDATGAVVAAIFPAVRAAATSGVAGALGNYTIPNGVAHIVPYFFIESPSGTDLGGANGVFFRDVVVRRRMVPGEAATFMADAVIGTAQIDTLNASKITAGTITTDRLVLNAVTNAPIRTSLVLSVLYNSVPVSFTSFFAVDGPSFSTYATGRVLGSVTGVANVILDTTADRWVAVGFRLQLVRVSDGAVVDESGYLLTETFASKRTAASNSTAAISVSATVPFDPVAADTYKVRVSIGAGCNDSTGGAATNLTYLALSGEIGAIEFKV